MVTPFLVSVFLCRLLPACTVTLGETESLLAFKNLQGNYFLIATKLPTTIKVKIISIIDVEIIINTIDVFFVSTIGINEDPRNNTSCSLHNKPQCSFFSSTKLR